MRRGVGTIKNNGGEAPNKRILEELRKLLTIEKSTIEIDPKAVVAVPRVVGDTAEFEEILAKGAAYNKIDVQVWLSKMRASVPEIVLCFENKPPLMAKGYITQTTITDCGAPLEYLPEIVKKVAPVRYKEHADLVKENGKVNGEELKNTLAGLPAYRFEPYLKDFAEAAIKNWKDVAASIFGPYDPILAKIYMAYVPPIPKAKYAPHTILVTNTGVGKSTLGRVVGEVYMQATVVSIIGGKLENGVMPGIVHGKDYMVQIEQFEVDDPQLLTYVHDLLANGVTERGVYGTTIQTRFTGPLVLTGNIGLDPQRPLANVATMLANPEAVGSRFIPLILPNLEPPRRDFDRGTAKEAVGAVRWLARKAVYEVYADPRVVEWLEDTVIEGWDAVQGAVTAAEWRLESARAYAQSFAENGMIKVRSMAIAHAIASILDEVYKERTEAVPGLLELAEQALEDFVALIVKGIKSLSEEVVEEYERLVWRLANSKKMKFQRIVIEALFDIITEMARGRLDVWTQPTLEIPLQRLRDEAMARWKGKMSDKMFKARLRAVAETDVGRIIDMKIEDEKIRVSPRRLTELHRDMTRLREGPDE